MTTGARELRRIADPTQLLPAFGVRVDELLERMRARGFDPLLWETMRTTQRAAMLARRGTGSARSMHCYGAAADIICGAHKWGCASEGCSFFSTLGDEAERLGLTWGGRWKSRPDSPHVQGVKVSQQDELRALPDQVSRAEYVAAKLGPL